MSDRLPVVIAGGGIGGLAAALAVAGTGLRALVLERSGGHSEAGAGIQLGPNAVKMLNRLGVGKAVAAVASVPRALLVRSGGSGELLSELQLGSTIERRHGAPYWVVHRADLHRCLLQACETSRGIEVRTRQEVVSVADQGSAGVEVACAAGSVVKGSALIGADGLWSQVRAAVAPDFTPAMSGYCAYRGLLPAESTRLPADVVGAWLSPSVHVVHYPVSSGRQINFVVIVHGPWTGQGWNTPVGAGEVLEATTRLAHVLQNDLAQVPEWHKWSLPKPVHLGTWSRGSVTLLGDAAHAMLPFFAQGGAMALEDAVALADSINRQPRHLPEAFARYATLRMARVAHVQAASTANGRIFHLAGPAAAARDAALRLLPHALLQRRFDWLYGYELPVA